MSHQLKWWSFVLGLLAILGPSSVTAQEQPVVPEPLKAWVPWVLQAHEDWVCARGQDDQRACDWPGHLSLNATATQGRFTLTVHTDRDTLVRLPGDNKSWPQEVQSQDGPLVVQASEEFPMVRVPKGRHQISGLLLWPSPPELIRVDPHIGTVSVTVLGSVLENPRLDEQGRLWLQNTDGGAKEDASNSLRVSIYRKIQDGVPLQINNRFDLNVSGRAREVDLGAILLPNARPTALRSDLPVQLSAKGELKIYVRPGTHTVEVQTVLSEAASALTVPAHTGDVFDPQEVWIWEPNTALRSVELSGLQSVDPERTSLPEAWRGKTTFLAEPAGSLVLKETRRGEVEQPPNELRLSRELWLDLDGRGYTVRDSLTGTMHQSWRLDYRPEAQLGRVTRRNEQTDLLITQTAADAPQGIELRQAKLDLLAELRLEEARGSFQAVGWDHDVQQLSARLNLPPGWELLGGQGVDQMKGTWVASWTLFDFFFLLMVSLSLGKLVGWRWAPVAALALCLSHGHGDAPRWIWIFLLATLALLRVLPSGWVRRATLLSRGLALVILAVSLAPYAKEQIRFALNPQVAYGGGAPENNFAPEGSSFAGGENDRFVSMMQEEVKNEAPVSSSDIMRKPKSKPKQDDYKQRSQKKIQNGWMQQKSSQLRQIDPNAVVQTGPGVPTWKWRSWNLSWTGPVGADHEVSLWLLSPGLNRAATLLRIALLVLMSLLLIAKRDMTWNKPGDKNDEDNEKTPTPPKSSFWQHLLRGAPVLLAVFAGHALWSGGASAENLPGLEALEERLAEAQNCQGPCVVVSRADFAIQDRNLQMRAEVHVQKDSAYPLPGPAELLRLDEVKVDGLISKQLRRMPGGQISVRLGPGRHVVELRGTLADRNVITLQLGQKSKPRYVSVKTDSWGLDGLSKEGIPDSSLQFTREETGKSGSQDRNAGTELPPWYSLHREIVLGLPWQIRNHVKRTDSERPGLIKIPLLEGEKIIDESIRVEGNLALVAFERGASTVSYTSEIPISPQITLNAAKEQPWTETWTIECSRMWRCDFSGLPPVRSVSSDKAYAPTWQPWPGESVSVDINRPDGVKGQARTVDRVKYSVTPGKRLLQAQLDMTVRASQGGWIKVTPPADISLQSVTIAGKTRNIRPREGKVEVPLIPGKQNITLIWQQPWERGVWETAPAVMLDSQMVNASIEMNLGEDRWLLWTQGPSWGPTVLYWSHMLVLLILALLLGRMKALPLKTWEWLLLAIGMAQLPVVAMVPVVAWFVLLAWRKWQPNRVWWQFSALQLLIVGMTFFAMIALYAAVHTNLLIDPDMQLSGAGSSNDLLRWYVDRTDGALPSASILSVPLLAFRVTMLLWALWLVARLLKWLPWGWRAFSTEGLWRMPPKPEPLAPAAPAPVVPGPPKMETPSPDADPKT